ncbi:MAG: glutamine synthetase family protein [Candidatus Aenigmatarchaeota archaeon]
MSRKISSALLKEMGIKFVEAKFQDNVGELKSRTLPVWRYDAIKEGYGFDGSSCGFVGVENSDMVAKPIESSFRIINSNGYKTAFFLCDIEKDGKPFPYYGRNILKNLLEKIPYKVYLGPEIEFYLTQNYLPLDEGNYMISNPTDKGEKFKKDFMFLLEELNSDFRVQVSHHEVGPSQHEFELKYNEPVEMIDTVIAYKYFLRNFAKERGYDVTFMPKPFEGKAGSGMHFHVSFWEDDTSLFFGNRDEISEEAKHAIGGVLEYSPEIALVTNGTINSYKRLVVGHEAPVYCVYGYSNRSALVRIPRYKPLTPSITRIEVRSVDGLNNHYLACAALIKAMLIGMKKKIEPVLFEGCTYSLSEEECKKLGIKIMPRSLEEAIEKAKEGTILKELLGENFYRLIEIKERELEEFKNSGGALEDKSKITEWEIKKYFFM